MKQIKVTLALIVAFIMFSGFFGEDVSVADQKKARLKENTSILELLYKSDPKAKGVIAKSYGYAAFNSTGINLFVISSENGEGLAKVTKTGKITYMDMWSGGVGVGMGVKDFRAVFVFSNKKVFDSFVNSGWEANAQAEAAAKAEDKGGDVGGEVTVAPGIKLYKLTKTGLAAQATIQGTKYWKNDDLNK